MPKKTKAIKVTDQNKPWNKKSKTSNYKFDSILQNKMILIVCEGQTEKLYFESFPVLGVEVKAIDLKGQSKLKLVESSKELVDSLEDKDIEVWCVFDMDVKRGAREFADFDNAIYKATQFGYRVAYSNDSFELWFYLHYNYSDTKELRTFYYNELSKQFGLNYVKDGKKYNFCLEIYSMLHLDINSSQQNAIDRAKALYESQQHLAYHEQNPVTKVYDLVEELNRNLRQ